MKNSKRKTKMKKKQISRLEFDLIMKKNWMPVKLSETTLLYPLKRIPKNQRIHVYASGCSLTNSYSDECGGKVVGGCCVFRDAQDHPEPYILNKDHYVIIEETPADDSLLMCGPLKDSEHWINCIPDRLKKASRI